MVSSLLALFFIVLHGVFVSLDPTPSPIDSLPVASAAVILFAGLWMTLKRGVLRWPFIFLLGALSVAAIRSAIAGAPYVLIAASIVGLLLFPIALTLVSPLPEKRRRLAAIAIISLGFLQVPFLILNFFGTSPFGPVSGLDRFDGLFFSRGAYLGSYALAIAVLVVALMSRRRISASLVGLLFVSCLAWITENKLLFALTGVSVGAGLAVHYFTRSHAKRPPKLLLAVTIFLVPSTMGTILSFETPAGDWREPLTGSSVAFVQDLRTVVESIADRNQLERQELQAVDSLVGVIGYSVIPKEAEKFLLGWGAGLATSHQASDWGSPVTEASRDSQPMDRLEVTNPSGSTAKGPGSTFFAYVTEAGWLTACLLLYFLYIAIKRLALLVRPSHLASVVAPFVLLFLVTPVLESPVLPALLVLALSGLCGQKHVGLPAPIPQVDPA